MMCNSKRDTPFTHYWLASRSWEVVNRSDPYQMPYNAATDQFYTVGIKYAAISMKTEIKYKTTRPT